jgi:hypothetical protein
MVPHGVYGGQTVRVMYPDGSGREVEAKVPLGMTAGSVFHIKADLSPPVMSPDWHSISGDHTNIKPMALPVRDQSFPYRRNKLDTTDPHQTTTTSPLAARRLSSSDDERADPHHRTNGTNHVDDKTTITNDQKLLKVIVPPHAKVGSTVHVQIPGEDRFIAAQIPPNCTEFHVQYKPRPEPTISVPSAIPPPTLSSDGRYSPLRHFTSHTTSHAPPVAERRQDSSPRQTSKKLMVVVPPGVKPGKTLHVEVPGEPGRVLSAQVPPGNVREFYVSYVPRT